mgnify:CR=1 FL=1
MLARAMSEISQKLFAIIPPDPRLIEDCAEQFAESAVACVLMRTSAQYALPDSSQLGPLVASLQRDNIAVLFDWDGSANLHGADGVLANTGPRGLMDNLEHAVAAIKPHGIVGAGGFETRHDAMVAAEKDIDFVLFESEPVPGAVSAELAVTEWASWWSELFTVPCIACAANADELNALATTGCDFLGVTIPPGITVKESRTLLERGLAALQTVRL